MIKATVIRTDEKAIEHGEIAYRGDFATSSEGQIRAYFSTLAEECDTVGSFRIEIEGVSQ